MVLMTPEQLAARAALQTEMEAKARIARGFSGGDPNTALAEYRALESQMEIFNLLAEADRKLAELIPFWDLYQGLKPDAIKILATGIDEVLDVMIQVAGSVTKYDEFRRVVAQGTRATYQAYIDVGFEPDQAFACTLRTMEVFDEALKNSFRNAKIEKK